MSEENMTIVDAATDNKTLSTIDRKLPKLFETVMKELPARRYAVAVNGGMLANNEFRKAHQYHEPIFDVYEVPLSEHGESAMRRATHIGNYRHVEMLSASWCHHDPSNPLASNRRRVGVMVTDGPIRVFSDTEEFMERMEKQQAEEAEDEERRPLPSLRTGC